LFSHVTDCQSRSLMSSRGDDGADSQPAIMIATPTGVM
jgi:hypothetical protein